MGHYIFGFAFGKDTSKELSLEEFKACQEPCWAHLDIEQPDTRVYLEKESGIDPQIVEAMLTDQSRPRFFQQDEKGCLVILRAINFNPDSHYEDMVSIRLWIEEKRVITVVRKNLRSAEEIADQMRKGNGPKNIPDFTILLLKQIISHVEPVIADLDDCTDEWEKELPDDGENDLFGILADARKEVLTLRHHLFPERDVLYQLGHAQLNGFTKAQLRQIMDQHDRISRYVDDLYSIKERIVFITDELKGRLATHTGRAMYIFSLVAVIFLPLTFLTGLFGINVGGIPGADTPWAFGAFSLIMLLIAIGIVWFFRKIKWF